MERTKTYINLNVNQKINFKVLLIECGFKSLSVIAYGKNLKINPINPIFDK
jgi:hypothetical protein